MTCDLKKRDLKLLNMAYVNIKNFKALKKLEGQRLPKGDWIRITQQMINDFAAATHDHQWIHTDPARARTHAVFKGTIAHGMLSLALVPGMIDALVKIESMKMGVNYGLNKVRFTCPVPVGSRLRLSCHIRQLEEFQNGGLKIIWACTVEMQNSKKPACVCDFIAQIYE